MVYGVTRIARLSIIVMISFGIWAIASIRNSDDRLVFACECVQPKPPLVSLDESNAVFSGKVVSLQITDDLYPSREVTFDVITIWKGISNDSVKVTTGMGGADCGYDFENGKDYLVYAYGDPEKEIGTDYCSRTKPLDKADADLVALGSGDNTFAGEMTTYTGSIYVVHPFIIIALIGIAGAVIATLVLRKGK